MAASAAHAASKPSKKKAAKAPEQRAQSPTPSMASGVGDRAADSQEDGTETPLIKELHKNIRNLNKKITNASKTDSLLAQHPDKTLDELVASKVINTDQKAQILKKPALKSQLAQMEEQLSQLHKAHDHYRLRAKNERLEWEKSQDKLKDDVIAETQQKFDKSLRGHLLVLSQFLRLAAYRREEAKDLDSDESQAIEGVLLAIYTGDENAVASMLKLIDGSNDSILSVPGEPLKTTFSIVKALAQEYKTPFYPEAAPATGPEPDKEAAAPDPPTASTAAIEKDATESALVNGQEQAEPPANGTADADLADAKVPDDAVSTAATTHWERENDEPNQQEWVNVETPPDASEKEVAAGSDEMPAMTNNTRSWADEQPDAVVEAPRAHEANDGFHQVQRNRGRQDREPGSRGRGRGEGRGRPRGDGRGRGGRGRGNGNGGAQWRPARRNEES